MSAFDVRLGDVLEKLREMPDESVNCVVTSPPYYGLRDYQTAKWEGGDLDCGHGVERWEGDKQTQGAQSGHAAKKDRLNRTECSCGAIKVDHQIGLERTPELFISRLVEVFREVRRVLRSDGTLWVNIGDSYAGSWGAQSRVGPLSESSTLAGNGHVGGGPKLKTLSHVQIAAHPKGVRTGSIPEGSGLKPKDLIGIPWMMAFALRTDGWYLRQDIIWSKPNPMPESVRDRCTKAHEYVFMLTKSGRYACDMEAVKEPCVADHEAGNNTHKGLTAYNSGDDRHRTKQGLVAFAQKRRPSASKGAFNGKTEAMAATGQNAFRAVTETRNKRSVWTMPSQPTPDAHFATFPLELPETCILAGCPEGGLVLDPFSGAGTTGLAALKHGRRYIGIELNPEYIAISHRRMDRHCPLLA